MELLEPQPGFCIRSSLASKKDKKFVQNIYVNICVHEFVDQGKIEGKGGNSSWLVPYMCGKIRYDQEGDENAICNTVDVVFHPTSVMMAMANPQMHKLVRKGEFFRRVILRGYDFSQG